MKWNLRYFREDEKADLYETLKNKGEEAANEHYQWLWNWMMYAEL